jgi:hypothetical protein
MSGVIDTPYLYSFNQSLLIHSPLETFFKNILTTVLYCIPLK